MAALARLVAWLAWPNAEALARIAASTNLDESAAAVASNCARLASYPGLKQVIREIVKGKRDALTEWQPLALGLSALATEEGLSLRLYGATSATNPWLKYFLTRGTWDDGKQIFYFGLTLTMPPPAGLRRNGRAARPTTRCGPRPSAMFATPPAAE